MSRSIPSGSVIRLRPLYDSRARRQRGPVSSLSPSTRDALDALRKAERAPKDKP